MTMDTRSIDTSFVIFHIITVGFFRALYTFHLKTMLIKSIQRTEIRADKRETVPNRTVPTGTAWYRPIASPNPPHPRANQAPRRQQPLQSRSQITTPSEHPLPNQIYSLLSILRGRYHLNLIRLKDRCPITVHHKHQPVILKNRIRIHAINRARTLFQSKRIIQFLPDRSFHLKTMPIKSIQRTEIRANKRQTVPNRTFPNGTVPRPIQTPSPPPLTPLPVPQIINHPQPAPCPSLLRQFIK